MIEYHYKWTEMSPNNNVQTTFSHWKSHRMFGMLSPKGVVYNGHLQHRREIGDLPHSHEHFIFWKMRASQQLICHFSCSLIVHIVFALKLYEQAKWCSAFHKIVFYLNIRCLRGLGTFCRTQYTVSAVCHLYFQTVYV